jgi:hypothetical protein
MIQLIKVAPAVGDIVILFTKRRVHREVALDYQKWLVDSRLYIILSSTFTISERSMVLIVL